MDINVSEIPKRKTSWFSAEFRIAFRLFWCFCLFLAIISRWSKTGDLMEEISDSSSLNLEYAKEIDVETYLMTRSQLSQLFHPTNSPLVHWEVKQTGVINDPSSLYFVLRLRNRGELDAYGRLKAHSERWRRESGVDEREIPVQFLPARMHDFQTIILGTSWDIGIFDNSDRRLKKKPEKIYTEWTSLYTEKNDEQ